MLGAIKSRNSKATWEKCPSYNTCLLNRNNDKKKQQQPRKTPSPHLPSYSASTHEDRGCLHYTKVPEISVGSQIMDRFRFLPIGILRITSGGGPLICCSSFDKPAHCRISLHLQRDFGKGIKNDKGPIPLGWPGLIGKSRSIFWSLM